MTEDIRRAWTRPAPPRPSRARTCARPVRWVPQNRFTVNEQYPADRR